jgi:hypothetical protein
MNFVILKRKKLGGEILKSKFSFYIWRRDSDLFDEIIVNSNDHSYHSKCAVYKFSIYEIFKYSAQYFLNRFKKIVEENQ